MHEVAVASRELNSAIDELVAKRVTPIESTPQQVSDLTSETGLSPEEEQEINDHLKTLGYFD